MMKYNELSDAEHSIRSNFEDDVLSIDHCNYHCELKIKTPSSKTLIQEIIEKCVDLHGAFSQCEFDTPVFKQPVYTLEYRRQKATSCNSCHLNYILLSVCCAHKIFRAKASMHMKYSIRCLSGQFEVGTYYSLDVQ